MIDDEPQVVELLRTVLEIDGYTVHDACDGPSGLAAARAASPDVVVVDVMMPGMDGVEVCTRLHAMDPRLPVVVLTAVDDRKLEKRCLEAGATRFLTKPLYPGDLVEAIVSVLATTHPVS